MLDRPPLGGVEDAEKLGMNRRLAAADLNDIRLALVADNAIEHELNLLEAAMRQTVRRGFAVTDRAGEIALVGDLDEREAGVLLMVGAEPAVVGAAVFDRCVEFQ